ncbi:hypothetical protein [Enterococcus faecalis]|uniref:hypothetical protein n=1 Tax=Enterococcus faecalis TaxID=1351 RepID=UPI002DB77E4B|nr:hypothetical protein [Enterococcus faecalis]MEB7792165.1 hypothetical protein [Enterococcus faecalis]MEB7810191.1 hypothetical protein [Enterococcus faecalis]
MRKIFVFLGVLTMVVLSTTFSQHSFAQSSSILPGVEIKYNLDSNYFTDEKIQAEFMAKKDESLKVYFLETKDNSFFQNDYIQRLRVYEGKKNFDLTYKKRFKNMSISEGIQELEDHGFTGLEKNYKFEIDSKNGEDLLSVSRKEKIKVNANISYNNVDEITVMQAFKENAPKKIQTWNSENWFNQTISRSHLRGPAIVQTYVGVFNGEPVDIETWDFNGKVMIELSMKTTQDSAPKIKENWENKLKDSEFLSTDQRGKTNFVLFP